MVTTSPSLTATTVAVSAGVEAAGEHPGALGLQLGVERVDVLVRLLHLLVARLGLALDHVHGQQVLLHHVPPGVSIGPLPILTLVNEVGRSSIDTTLAESCVVWNRPDRADSERQLAYPGRGRRARRPARRAPGTPRRPARGRCRRGRAADGRWSSDDPADGHGGHRQQRQQHGEPPHRDAPQDVLVDAVADGVGEHADDEAGEEQAGRRPHRPAARRAERGEHERRRSPARRRGRPCRGRAGRRREPTTM